MSVSVEQTAELLSIRDQLEESMLAAKVRQIHDNLYQYAVVDRSLVRYADGVDAAVSCFTHYLGIPEPEVRYFVPTVRASTTGVTETFGYHRDIAGLCVRSAVSPARIFIHAGLADYWDAIAVTLHELRHAAQPLSLRGGPAELDADDYAHQMLGRYPFDRDRRNP